MEELLGENYRPILQFAKPYLMSSFGSFTRMDYGTGHETSFALFLLVLTLVRFFDPVPEVERQLVLVVFLRYLRLCWKLQDVYRLEPAGSHGVWGLDDSHFLPYIFGSSQLRGTPPALFWGSAEDLNHPDLSFRSHRHTGERRLTDAIARYQSLFFVNIAHPYGQDRSISRALVISTCHCCRSA